MKILSILLLTGTLLFGLSNDQIIKLQTVYHIGKEIRAFDGFTFENTLCAIMLQESSAGINLIGDKYKNGKLKNFYDSSLGIFQIKLKTAKYIIKHDRFMKNHFKYLLNDDRLLVNLLFTNTHFSALVAGAYLRMNYEIAKKRHYKNPWMSAISRYNGGWNNTTYKHKIRERLKFVKSLKIF